MPNVARAANGGVASASSTLDSNHPASGTINGDRKGLNWGSGGGWKDNTLNVFPDWLQVTFNGAQSIGEIDVFSLQDNYLSPVEPTPGMIFTKYGPVSFQVQYWTGSAWADVPGGNVTGNNKVWRQFIFPSISTNKIRVLVNSVATTGNTRIVEVEAWTAASPVTYQISGVVLEDTEERETVWVEDAVPAGGVAGGVVDAWTWVSANPTPFSGSLAHQSALESLLHNHYFSDATDTLTVGTGDTLFAYVYIDAANPPVLVSLQWRTGTDWDHSAYWAASQTGTDGPDNRYMGVIPATGQWIRLEVPAALVGLEGRVLNGMNFILVGGRATWDKAGKWSAGMSSVTITPSLHPSDPQYGIDVFQPVVTDSFGQYSATLPANWGASNGGYLTATKAGYTFDGPILFEGGLSANITGQNFTGTREGLAISGTVTLDAAPLAGVTVQAIGITPVVTNGSGNYTLTVPYGWSGAVSCSLAGYLFQPTIIYSDVVLPQTGKNYTATASTATISGTVTHAGAGLGGVLLTPTGNFVASPTTTAADGTYSLPVPISWVGNVSPSKQGFVFAPILRTYTTGDYTDQDYVAQQTQSVNVYTTPGTYTWTKSPNAIYVMVEMVGAGGGGGAGGKGPAGTRKCGGNGGGGGGLLTGRFLASSLPATAQVVLGAGGPGGAGTTSGTGGSGAPGGTNSFDGLLILPGGGSGGGGGSTPPGGQFPSPSDSWIPGAGCVGSGGTDQPASVVAANDGWAAGGGGGGGGIGPNDVASSGGPGSNAGSGIFGTPIAGGIAGSSAGSNAAAHMARGGGGGAGANGSVNAKNFGFAGGSYGAGGGGGGATTTGSKSGDGGSGAPGIIIITQFS